MSEAQFESIYRENWVHLVRLATLLTGSQVLAEDVVQDAFIALRDRFQSVDSPSAYVRRSVINGCRSSTRRERFAHREELRIDTLTALPPEIDEMWTRVQELPDHQRAVVVLRFYEDLPESEIASILGCRLGTVKSRLHRALTALKGLSR